VSTKQPDRDRSIEEMLRRSASRSAGDPSGRCLDAETLAEWIDGDLNAADVSAAEAHVSSCARCQQVVAAIVRTTPSTSIVIPWWRRGWAIGALVPLTAAATALAIWIATPDVQRREASPVAARQVPPAAVVVPPPARERPQEEQRRLQEAAPARPQTAPQTAGTRAKDGLRNETSGRYDGKLEASNNARRDLVAGGVPAPAAPAAPPSPATAQSGAAASATALEAQAATAFRDAAAAPQREGTLAKSDALAKSAFARAPAEIVSPDQSVRWRPGASGSIHRSIDGGATWTALTSGATDDLTAGSAPSSAVCWIVGRRGTVLVTADGVQWRRVTFPEPVDLTAIQANDLANATVIAGDGRRFRTADGGQTWTRQ